MSAAVDPARRREELSAVLALERSLAESAIRADRAALLERLHPDFEEVGRSGMHFHRDAIIDLLVDEPGDGYALLQESAEHLGPDTILVTYAAREHGAEHAASRHVSIWQRHHDRWQLRYHQGTRVS
jgi:ribonuclease HI